MCAIIFVDFTMWNLQKLLHTYKHIGWFTIHIYVYYDKVIIVMFIFQADIEKIIIIEFISNFLQYCTVQFQSVQMIWTIFYTWPILPGFRNKVWIVSLLTEELNPSTENHHKISYCKTEFKSP